MQKSVGAVFLRKKEHDEKADRKICKKHFSKQKNYATL